MKVLANVLITLALTICSTGSAQTFEDAQAALLAAHKANQEEDLRASVRRITAFAEQGDVRAQALLGKLYSGGTLGNDLEISERLKIAMFWLRKAADQSDAHSKFILGIYQKQGWGVDTTKETAPSAITNQSQEIARLQAEAELTKKRQLELEEQLKRVQQEQNRPSLVPLKLDSTGSGFRVARGAFVTNHHVIEGCRNLRINDEPAQLRGGDVASDLALLTVNIPGPSASLRAQRVGVGEPVAVAGYPLRGLLSGFNMTTGSLSSMSGIGGDTRYFQITAPVQPGNSGGPMLDSAGNLVGVVVSKLDTVRMMKITGDIPQNVNFAINVNVLRSFLDANGVDYGTGNSGAAVLPTVIAERARGFTVLVECWK